MKQLAHSVQDIFVLILNLPICDWGNGLKEKMLYVAMDWTHSWSSCNKQYYSTPNLASWQFHYPQIPSSLFLFIFSISRPTASTRSTLCPHVTWAFPLSLLPRTQCEESLKKIRLKPRRPVFQSSLALTRWVAMNKSFSLWPSTSLTVKLGQCIVMMLK